MKWRKSLQGKDEPERPFARRWAYETLKEAGGVLLQNLGLLAGTVAGVISNKLGMPVHTAVTTGLIVGQAAGMAGRDQVIMATLRS
ncbi:hypothetical protein ACFHW1_19845 [Micromonospora sp. LOL_014]|uniref:hypothetical protein n=1 Tax=Micromonospora sp. LOL_014 TaxID=3345415 RepID=UPI003A83FC08